MRVNGTVLNDRRLRFLLPSMTQPKRYQIYVEDAVIATSPAVCMRLPNGGFYTVPTDADCGSDPLFCRSDSDHLRSLTYSALEVIQPLQGRRGSVTVSNRAALSDPLCAGTVSVVPELGAYFDQNTNGVVEGFPTASPTLTFPNERVVNVLSRDGYDITQGSMYATDGKGQANLVIVARIYTCPHGAPQFVAAHFALYGDDPQNPTIQPIRMVAGDDFNEILTSGDNVQKGVVMRGGFDGTLDRTKITAAVSLAEGRATGLVQEGAFGAEITFEFAVPVELR